METEDMKDISKKRKIKKINTEEDKNRSNQKWSGHSSDPRDERHEMSPQGRRSFPV